MAVEEVTKTVSRIIFRNCYVSYVYGLASLIEDGGLTMNKLDIAIALLEDAKKQVNKPDYRDVQFQKYQDDLKLARRRGSLVS